MLQLQADMAGVRVVRPAVTETTTLGAAYLAGLAVRFWHDTSEIESNWSIDRIFEPRLSPDHRESMLHTWHRAVERARDWA